MMTPDWLKLRNKSLKFMPFWSKDTRQDEDEKRLTKVENQVEKILELLEKHMPVDGEQNQVGQILELLERRIPFDGGHVKTPPSKLHEEHRIDIEMVGLDDSGIEKVAANSPKFVDEDEIRNMNDKEPMETLRLRKTKPILTPPNAKAVAKKRAKLVGGKALNNEQLPIPQKGRSRAKKSDTKAIEVNVVTMSSSCSVVHGPQTRGTQNCKASQWLRTPFVKFDVMKKRPQLKPSSIDNNVDNNIHDNLDQLFDNLLDQLGGNVVPEIPKGISCTDETALRGSTICNAEGIVVLETISVDILLKKFPNKDHKQKILCQPSDDTMKDIVEDYFGIYKYTGPLHACEEIYMPFNHGENHWLCLNVNMEKRVAYLFDSSRCIDTDEDQKNQATLLVQSLHKLLQYVHGEDYVQDVSSFAFQWLEDMPRQDNSYDCGLFVIKYMQGKPLPSGVIKFDYLHRARLLLDLVIYQHNSAPIVGEIAQYKAEASCGSGSSHDRNMRSPLRCRRENMDFTHGMNMDANCQQDEYTSLKVNTIVTLDSTNVCGEEVNASDYKPDPLEILDYVKINNTLVSPISTIKGVLKDSKEKDLREDLLKFDIGTSVGPANCTRNEASKSLIGGNKEVDLPLFSFTSVSAATDNFSDANKLGEGGLTCLQGGCEKAFKKTLTRIGGITE
ncbi:unnamed protein product [Camellia sinensis]